MRELRSGRSWSSRSLAVCVATVLLLGCAESEEPAGPELMPQADGGPSSGDGGTLPRDAGAVLDGGLGAVDAHVLSNDAAPVPIADAASGASGCLATRVAAVRPIIDQCRSCHNQYALAGKSRFVLTSEPAMDEASLQTAFKMLGRDLITMPSQEATRMHPGGKLLEKGTTSYTAWDALLQALASPTAACVGGT